jgi:hypothetical protein
MFQLTLEYLPHGDETKAEKIGFARICNLRQHEPGSDIGSFHGYFEVEGARQIDAFIKDYPRKQGTPWDLIAVLLRASGAGVTNDGR